MTTLGKVRWKFRVVELFSFGYRRLFFRAEGPFYTSEG